MTTPRPEALAWDTRANDCAEAICLQFGITAANAERGIKRLLLGEFIQIAKETELHVVAQERERCFRWAIGRVPRSRAAQAIRDGDDPNGSERDPSVCWRCGTPLHPGHFCGDQP